MRLPLLPMTPETNAAAHIPTLRLCPRRSHDEAVVAPSVDGEIVGAREQGGQAALAATAARSRRVPKVGIADARSRTS